MKITAIIIARHNSGRLPEKHNRMIGDKTMMKWIIDRCQPANHIVIATTNDSLYYYDKYKLYSDIPVSVIAPLYDDNNIAGRIHALSLTPKLDSDYYISISGDCPLVDWDIVLKLVNELDKYKDYHAIIGNFTYQCGIDIYTKEAMKFMIYGENLDPRLIPGLNVLEVPIDDKIDMFARLTVDNHADLALQRELFRKLGDNYDYKHVLELIYTHDDIFKLNDHVGQRKPGDISKNVNIITEGNNKIGMGHVARSIGIAQYYSECCNDNVRIYINNNPDVISMLERYGYERGLDYFIGIPVDIVDTYSNTIFIHDTYIRTTLDYSKIYLENPVFGVNLRYKYPIRPIESDVLVSFGQGDYKKYGEIIFNKLVDKNKLFVYNEPSLLPYLKGTKRVITVWSNTAREAIICGLVPECYSANEIDDFICEELDEKGVIKWIGKLNSILN